MKQIEQNTLEVDFAKSQNAIEAEFAASLPGSSVTHQGHPDPQYTHEVYQAEIPAPSQGRKKGTPDKPIDSIIAHWVDETVASRERLLQVELGLKWISMPYLAKVLEISLSALRARDHMFEPVDQAMRDAGIIVEGHSYTACDWRRKLLQWFDTLTAEERRTLPLFRGRIQVDGFIDAIPGLGFTQDTTRSELVKQTLLELSQEAVAHQGADASAGNLAAPVTMAGRARSEDIARRIQTWASAVITDRKALLELPLSSRSDLVITRGYLKELHGVSSEKLTEHQDVIASVVQAMTHQRIIIEGHSGADCDTRRRILAWFEGLTSQQKCELPLYGGNIMYQGGFDHVEGLGTGIRGSSLFQPTLREISDQVIEIKKSMAPPEPPPSRMKGAEAVSILENWVANFDLSRESLLTVVLNQDSGEPQLSVEFISTCTSINDQAVRNIRYLTSGLTDAMVAQKIILPGYSSYECDWRRRLLAWYEGFSEAEKLNIPTFGNKIKMKGFLDSVDTLKGLKSVLGLPLIVITMDEITSDLRSIGIVSDSYKTVAERVADKALVDKDQSERALNRFLRYRDISVGSVSDLAVDDQEPFLALYHLFAASSLGSHGESGISNYQDAFRYFRDGLIEIGFEGHEPIQDIIGIYSLARFKKYLEGMMIEGRLSSNTCQTYLSAARKMMQTAVGIKNLGLSSFIATEGFETTAETDIYRPYSPSERGRIAEAILTAIASTNELIKPYAPSGVGCDPLDITGAIKRGFGTLENARWIFENKLSCTPVGFKTADKSDPYQRAFIKILGQQAASIDDIYRSWGVLYSRDSSVLAPYVARLAQVTGLNTDSLVSLDVEDFVEAHPLTNRPCLRYWKERSTGEREYHLDLFKADITWLTTSQGREVKKLFDEVIAVTSNFRGEAPKDVAAKLFIYRSSSPRTFKKIKSLEGSASTIISKIFEKFVDEYELKLDSGEPLSISPSRFRPSFISELVERGVSLREIQVILGHKYMTTTLGYLDRLDLNRVARKILDEAIRDIQVRTVATSPKPKVTRHVEDEIIFKTPMGGCRNVLNPPDFIKSLRSYIPGKPCSLYNKCLACDNRVITKANLPELFAMRRDYRHTIETTRVLDSPYGEAILENLAMLDEILDPAYSDFTAQELEEAERLSEYFITSAAVEGITQ